MAFSRRLIQRWSALRLESHAYPSDEKHPLVQVLNQARGSKHRPPTKRLDFHHAVFFIRL